MTLTPALIVSVRTWASALLSWHLPPTKRGGVGRSTAAAPAGTAVADLLANWARISKLTKPMPPVVSSSDGVPSAPVKVQSRPSA
jgi:hypothetical protein